MARSLISLPVYYPPIFYVTLFLLAQDDGTDIEFRNVGFYTSDAGEIPKRTQTTIQKCFQNDYVSVVKEEKIKILRFTGRKIDTSEFLTPKVCFAPRPPPGPNFLTMICLRIKLLSFLCFALLEFKGLYHTDWGPRWLSG